MMLALPGYRVFEDLVSHFASFELDDADEFIPFLPDLALLQF